MNQSVGCVLLTAQKNKILGVMVGGAVKAGTHGYLFVLRIRNFSSVLLRYLINFNFFFFLYFNWVNTQILLLIKVLHSGDFFTKNIHKRPKKHEKLPNMQSDNRYLVHTWL